MNLKKAPVPASCSAGPDAHFVDWQADRTQGEHSKSMSSASLGGHTHATAKPSDEKELHVEATERLDDRFVRSRADEVISKSIHAVF